MSEDFFVRDYLQRQNGDPYPYWYQPGPSQPITNEKREPSMSICLYFVRVSVHNKIGKAENKLQYNKTGKRKNRRLVERYRANDTYLANLEESLKQKGEL